MSTWGAWRTGDDPAQRVTARLQTQPKHHAWLFRLCHVQRLPHHQYLTRHTLSSTGIRLHLVTISVSADENHSSLSSFAGLTSSVKNTHGTRNQFLYSLPTWMLGVTGIHPEAFDPRLGQSSRDDPPLLVQAFSQGSHRSRTLLSHNRGGYLSCTRMPAAAFGGLGGHSRRPWQSQRVVL